jgi:carbonic anhydrase
MLLKKLAIITTVVTLQTGINVGAKEHLETDKTNGEHAISTHWSYQDETGPSHWGQLSEKYALCMTGTQQSPIDITTNIKAELPPLVFDYNPLMMGIKVNDHSIYVEPTISSTTSEEEKSATLKIGDEAYHLLQFHFHTPSEEAINGKRADMVMHLVHKNDQGHLAVVAVLLNQGKANQVITQVWEMVSEMQNPTTKKPEKDLNINQLLPDDRNYYTLWGSLTTPPCSQGVKWIILKQPLTISAEQLAAFQKRYPNNARPLQEQGHRFVLSSD